MMTWLSRLLLVPAAIATWSSAALAHPGHVTSQGHGHDHWLALAIFGGLGIAAAVYGLWRMSARKRATELGESRNGRDG